MPKALTPEQFRERLLSIMDRKHHWAWPVLMGPGITKAQLKIHYQQEYLTYVRDFPVLLARGRCSRSSLAGGTKKTAAQQMALLMR